MLKQQAGSDSTSQSHRKVIMYGQYIRLFLLDDSPACLFRVGAATPTHCLPNQRGRLADGVQAPAVAVRSLNVISRFPV